MARMQTLEVTIKPMPGLGLVCPRCGAGVEKMVGTVRPTMTPRRRVGDQVSVDVEFRTESLTMQPCGDIIATRDSER